METGVVFNIQHFSTEDGPGIRTVVFLKGCPLRCRWCANPESQRGVPELGWTKGDCLGCGRCVRELTGLGCRFTEQGLRWNESGRPDEGTIDRVCPSAALHVIGRVTTVQDVLREVEKDRTFFDNSGGGLTVSGGEPLVQPDFAGALLREAKSRRIHTAMETCLYGRTEDLLSLAEHLDFLYADVKTMDDGLHRRNTGVSNERILRNLQAVRAAYPALPIRVRTPVIPGVNDNEKELRAIAAFVGSLNRDGAGADNPVRHELLKYHRLGLPKYESLGRPYPMGDAALTDEEFSRCTEWAYGT